ncbi:MAG: flagellin [Candidatus Hydrogenedentota bacterium]
MAFRINTNIPAMFAERNLTITNRNVEKNIEKLSSGLRINVAADDAAGLAISERLRTQVNGLRQARLNVQDGISLIQTAEGGISNIGNSLQRLRTLAVQAANDVMTTIDRYMIQLEFNQLLDEIDRQVSSTEFNTKKLLTGVYNTGGNIGSLVLQVGANKNDKISIQIPSLSTASLGTVLGSGQPVGVYLSALRVTGDRSTILGTNRGVMTRVAANSTISVLSSAINLVSETRAKLGALQNRLQTTFDFLGIALENQAASESRIRDLDISYEVVEFTKNQILVQTGAAALAQANVAPQSVLQLLQ